MEAKIKRPLVQEKEIVEHPTLPISGYNYSAVRDRLFKNGVQVSLNTVIRRAKDLGCHKRRRERKTHDRQAVIAAIGALLQHHASTHLLRPFSLPEPYTSPKDVFCLRETRMVNGYARISLFNHTIEGPKVPLH